MKRILALLLLAALVFTVFLPPVLADAQPVPADKSWDLAAGSAVLPTLEGESGEYQGIVIDATAGKFAPRAGDTQINAGTVLTIPVSASPAGATLTVVLSGGSATLTVDGQAYASVSGRVEIPLTAGADGSCRVEFTTQAYVKAIALAYSQPEPAYPGEPGEVAAEDTAWNLAAGPDALPAIQNGRGEFAGVLVDASAAGSKFAPRATDTQINAGTVLYIPVAAHELGATLTVTLSGGTASLTVDGTACNGVNGSLSVALPAGETSRYCQVTFTAQAYLSGLALTYSQPEAPYPGEPGEVAAKDAVWDLSQGGETIQGARGEYNGLPVDATSGKFAPRDGDVQINGGTVLYIPVAAEDGQGASLTLSGNNYNNLTVTLDGAEISVGKEVSLPQTGTARYAKVVFEGTGSCYLSAVTVDYLSDSVCVPHIVTVGAGQTYATIQAALDANDSSAEQPLVLLIAPGTYNEKVTVNKPWVSFQPLYKDGGEVRIQAGYYSSNTFDENGNFVPQDEWDVGTDQSGTVLLTSAATGFSASGITFVNTYNLTDHTAAGEQTPAVAFGSAADKVYLTGCRFLGRQDTLYLHGAGSRVKLENCYIEGTVDFVFGDADAWFENCQLFMACYPGKNNGYFTAPNTKKGNTGLVFHNCTLTADGQYADGGKISLGRPWQTEIYNETERGQDGSSYVVAINPDRKNPGYENTASAATFIECTMPDTLLDSRWSCWTRKDKNSATVDVTCHADVRFAEVNSRKADGTLAEIRELHLGTMTVADDSAALLQQLLAAMGIGEGIGNWQPQFTDHSQTKPVEPQPTPGTGSGTVTPPVATPVPAPTATPAPTVKPVATAKPEATEEPEATAEPAATPVPTASPAPTASPETVEEEQTPQAPAEETAGFPVAAVAVTGVVLLLAVLALAIFFARRRHE